MIADPYAETFDTYWQAGWRGILPLPYMRKKSPPTGYTGKDGETPSYADCTAWAETGPHNICLRLPDNVIGVDVDDYDGKNGAATLSALADKYGGLPASWLSTSRSDGISGIRLYRVPTGTTLVSGLPGIEFIQHHHRYVAAWPSLHPDTGSTYQWINETTGETVNRPPNTADLPELPPAWLHGLAVETQQHNKTVLDREQAQAILAAMPKGDPCAHILAHAGKTLTGGARHDTYNAAVLAVTGAGRRGCPGAETVLTRLRDTFTAETTAPGQSGRRTPGEAAAEWRRNLLGALALVADEPQGSTCPDDVDAWVDSLPEAPRTAQEAPDGDETPLGVLDYRIDWHTAYSDEDRDVSWLVEGIIERGRLVAMYSAPKAGKSLLALDWAAALATGRALPGHQPTGEIVPVLYCDYENTPADIVDRLRDLGYHDPADLTELHYLSLPVIKPLDTHPGGDALLAAAQTVGAQLVIVDTASRTISGEENAADTWAGWYACTGIKLKRAGIALLRLDHSGKDATRGQRGSSAKAGDVDLVLRLVADGDRLDLTAEERRQAYYSERVTYHRREAGGMLRHEVTTAADAHDDSVTALMRYLDAEGIPPDAGRPAVKAYLDERGYKHTKRTLEAALRGRRVLHPGVDQNRAGRGRFTSPPLPGGQRAAVPSTDTPLPPQNDGCPPLPTAAQRLPAAQTGTTGTAARAAVSLDTGSGQAPETATPLTSLLTPCQTCGKPAMTDPCTACRRDGNA